MKLVVNFFSISWITSRGGGGKQAINKCDLIYHYSYDEKNLEDCQCSYGGGKDDKGGPENYKLMTLI